MNITSKDQFAYTLGFLDCWIFMTGRTSKNTELLRNRHIMMIDLMRNELKPHLTLEEDQDFVNSLSRLKIHKKILNIAENRLTEEGIKKIMKTTNFDVNQL